MFILFQLEWSQSDASKLNTTQLFAHNTKRIHATHNTKKIKHNHFCWQHYVEVSSKLNILCLIGPHIFHIFGRDIEVIFLLPPAVSRAFLSVQGSSKQALRELVTRLQNALGPHIGQFLGLTVVFRNERPSTNLTCIVAKLIFDPGIFWPR